MIWMYCLGQPWDDVSLVFNSGRVLGASVKERTPVARQPQPPCPLAHFRRRDRKPTLTGINCGNSLRPLCATCRPHAITLKTSSTTQQYSFFPRTKCFRRLSVEYIIFKELAFPRTSLFYGHCMTGWPLCSTFLYALALNCKLWPSCGGWEVEATRFHVEKLNITLQL